jgi:LacI family transcriptional regulator
MDQEKTLENSKILWYILTENLFYKKELNILKATIIDVAKLAGVSITTVSRVVNNNYPVKDSTRKKVNEAIETLDFSPNSLARGLIQKKTFTIGVIVPSITNLFFPEVVKGIEKYLRHDEYTIFLCETGENSADEKLRVKRMMEHQVDGLIIIGPTPSNIENGFFESIAEEMPLVLVNGYNKGVKCHFVLTDEVAGTLEALDYLYKLEHRNITFLRGGQSYSYDLKQRVFADFMAKKGIAYSESNIIKIERGNSLDAVDLAREAVRNRLTQANPPTAIFCCNDWMATGAINAAKLLDIKIPDQFSVVGFDNIVVSELSEPKLTTVDQKMNELGVISARLLLEVIEQKGKDRGIYKRVTSGVELIKRESCDLCFTVKY